MKRSSFMRLLAVAAVGLGGAGCGRDYGYLYTDSGAGGGDGGAGGVASGVRSCERRLVFHPATSATAVTVAGEWNSWSPTAQPLKKQPDGSFAIALDLPPGEHAYKLVVDGTWTLDAKNPYTKYVGGVLNSDLRVDDCKAPLLTLGEWKVDVAARTLDATVAVEDGAGGRGIDPTSLAVTLDGAALTGATLDAGRLTLHAAGLADGKHTVRIDLKEKGGLAAKELYLPLWIEKQPFAWRDAFIYFAFIDRFQNGDKSNDRPVAGVSPQGNFQGGDWAGLKQRIESGWFDKLGVTAIWINGPNRQTEHSGVGSDGRQYSGYHGYWPASATETEPRFGTLDDLRAAVDAAHARGIRVLLDFVANHTHQDHPWWTQKMGTPYFNPLHNSDGSRCVCGDPECDWNNPDQRVRCWFTEYLPDLDYYDHDAVVAITDSAIDWLKASGADGLRVDALKHMPHIVGTTLRARLRDELEQTGVATYMVGETFSSGWTTDPGDGQHLIKQYVSTSEMNGQFDFPLYWAMLGTFAQGGSFAGLESVLSQTFTFYGPDAVMSPFLGNHDVPRFISRANGDPIGQEDGYKNPPPPPSSALPYQRLRLGLTLLLTIPGAPLIYYGDELGMPGAADPDNRRMMRFEGLSANEQATLEHARALGQTRRADPSLRRGDYQTIWVDQDGVGAVLVYARHAKGSPARIVALNQSSSPQQRMVPIPAALELPDGTTLRDALGGPSLTAASRTLPVALPAYGSAVYVPE